MTGKREAMRAAKIAVLDMLTQTAMSAVEEDDDPVQAEADLALRDSLARRWGYRQGHLRTPRAEETR